MTDPSPSPEPFEVVIAGGGVAALEAALALRELGRRALRGDAAGAQRGLRLPADDGP